MALATSAAADSYAWRRAPYFLPQSHTALVVTGALALSDRTMWLGPSDPFTVEPRAMIWRDWDGIRGKETGELFRLSHDPGPLENGNTLCGKQKATYAVIYETREGLGQAVQHYRQHLQASGEEVSGSAHALAERIRRLEQLHRHLLWKTFGAVALCLALLLAGGAWLSLHYRKVIEQNQLSAQLLKAYNDADVNLCDGQLCARVDLKAPRFGDHRQYLPVLPR